MEKMERERIRFLSVFFDLAFTCGAEYSGDGVKVIDVDLKNTIRKTKGEHRRWSMDQMRRLQKNVYMSAGTELLMMTSVAPTRAYLLQVKDVRWAPKSLAQRERKNRIFVSDVGNKGYGQSHKSTKNVCSCGL